MVFETGTGTDMIGPEQEVEFSPIYRRAHTFDGYRHIGGDWPRYNDHVNQVRASWVDGRALNWPLDDLRAALFVEARGLHHSGYPPSERLFIYMRDLDAMITSQVRVPLDESDAYRNRDLVAERAWPEPTGSPRYGTVIFDDQGQVLLRAPRDNYDGYHWTFAKGKAKPNEHPVDTARRATTEETGIWEGSLDIVGHVPGAFSGSGTGSQNFFYIARAVSVTPEPRGDTVGARWFPAGQAEIMIGQTTNGGGRVRDLAVLKAAVAEHNVVCGPVEQG
jgi:8-oxo-dGTP pyrophosphatase MutT (NUDIX family)